MATQKAVVAPASTNGKNSHALPIEEKERAGTKAEPAAPTYNVGHIYDALNANRGAEALQIASVVIRREPHSVEANVALAEALNFNLRHDEAASAAKRALSLDPFHLSARTTLAGSLNGRGYYRESKEILDEVIAVRPGHYNAHWLRALANLGCFNFAEGFSDYEYRFNHYQYRRRCPPHTHWRGEPTDVLFIYGEQGLGDQIQYARFISAARERSQGTVVLEVAPQLTVLFENMADQVWAGINDLSVPVSYTAHIPLISLPFVLGVETIDGSPYLATADVPVELGGAKVGFCWSGNPQNPRDALRSLTFEEGRRFEGLASFGALQPGPDLPFEMPMLAGCDLGETAMAINALELVVTVDTAVAHLAGAIGKECWLIEPRFGEWRWGRECSRSPWYDSIEIFRAPGGDRSAQIEQVCARLRERYPGGGAVPR